MKIPDNILQSVPKVVLHDHLDGGLRPSTIIELARDIGYDKLPTNDPGELTTWFHRGAGRGSLPLYLEGFAHTCGVMQTEEALERVAYEMI
jgi:adenosine deaminase